MRWWDKFWKDRKRTSNKGSVGDDITHHGKLRIVSEEKAGRSGTSWKHYTENTDHYSVKYNPSSITSHQKSSSPSLEASCSRGFSGRSHTQPLPSQGGHPHTTDRLVDSSIGRSHRARGSPPTLPSRSFFKPGLIVHTPDGKYIDMKFTTASATNCPSSSKLKEKSPIPSNRNSRGMMRSPNGPDVLNMHTPPMSTSSGASNLSIATPLGQDLHNEPLRNSGKSHANTSLIISGDTYGHSSARGDNINIWYNIRKEPSYRLPLPLATASSSVPVSPPYSTRRQLWKKGRLIGTGSFGHVYVGFNIESGEICAVKEVTMYAGDKKSRESAEQLNQEIGLLSRLHHPNIVQYYGSDMVGGNICIYLEYVSGGSIHKVLREYGPLGDVALRNFTRQILSGLAYLHSKNTVHRDVKGANILLQAGGRVKLADFGMAKHISGAYGPMSFKGSPYWIAPEVVKHSNADVSVDIWSLGCTVLEMATGKPPWHQYEAVAALFKIGNSNELPVIPDYISEEGKDFVRRCLQRDPLRRPTAAQLLEHPFVKCWTPLDRHIPSPEPVEAVHLPTITGNPQSRNPHFMDPGAIHKTRGSRNVTPIRNARSSENTPRSVSPIGNVLRQSQSSPNMSATRLTPILTAGILRPHDHPQTPRHRSERLTLSPLSSPQLASGSLEHLAGTNVSLSFYTKFLGMNIHGDQISTSRQSSSSSSSDNTCYQDFKPDMSQQVPQTPLSPQAILGSVKRDRIGTNVLADPTEPELAHRVSKKRPGKHVKFSTTHRP